MVLQTCLSESFVREEGASEGRNCLSGSSWSNDSMSARGLKLTNSSKSDRATAISGLWLGSVYFSGSFSWSCSERGREGWICRGSALPMERI